MSLRVPVAIIIVRLLKLLPQDQLNERLPAVLTDICHILRSKAQESRDLTRDTLTKICPPVGSIMFRLCSEGVTWGFSQRVPTSCTLLHNAFDTSCYKHYHMAPGDLDYCLPSIVAIIMDDIFGATGQEKDAEEYVSKMKEVKSSKKP